MLAVMTEVSTQQVYETADTPFDFAMVVTDAQHNVLVGNMQGHDDDILRLPSGQIPIVPGDVSNGFIVPQEARVSRVLPAMGINVEPGTLKNRGLLHLADQPTRVFIAKIVKPAVRANVLFKDPLWLPPAELPYDIMPNHYKTWLPHVLGGYSVNATFDRDPSLAEPHAYRPHDTIIRQKQTPYLGPIEPIPT